MANCVYCGAASADTRDHVPPKCLVRTSHRTNLWTVPACRDCNASASADEEYVRLIVIGALCHTPEADELFDGPIGRSMDRLATVDSLFWNSIQVQDGSACLAYDANRIRRVALKIVVGLATRLGEPAPPQSSRCEFMECKGHGEHRLWSPDFSFSHTSCCWDLWLFESLRIRVDWST